MGMGVWCLGFGVGGLGIGPNPHPPIPNPQSPIPNPQFILIRIIFLINNNKMKKAFYLIFLLLISQISSALRGIDVSYHNGEIDFSKVKSQVDFVIMRAGYGTKDEDSKEV